MTDRLIRQLTIASAASLALGAVVSSWGWGLRAALGLVAGGVWNLANLWCLRRLLTIWLDPRRSTRHVVWWLLVKCPGLYLTAFGLLSLPMVSLVGFGAGLTIVLVIALALFGIQAQRPVATLTK